MSADIIATSTLCRCGKGHVGSQGLVCKRCWFALPDAMRTAFYSAARRLAPDDPKRVEISRACRTWLGLNDRLNYEGEAAVGSGRYTRVRSASAVASLRAQQQELEAGCVA